MEAQPTYYDLLAQNGTILLPPGIKQEDVPPPKFIRTPKPEGMSGSMEEAYWKTEFGRWVDGYTTEEGHYLRGFHYFYLTQILIKMEDGPLIYPVWRDVDELVIEEWYLALENQEDLAIYKRRGIGLSVMFAALGIWRTITNPGTTYIMTSNNKPKSQRLFNEKVVISYKQLDAWIKPEIESKRQEGYLVMNTKGFNGMLDGNTSTIMARQTSETREDAAAFESERAIGAFIDELFLHRFAQEVRRSMQSCLKKGMSKMGPCVFGGSAGAVSEEGIKEAESIWKNSKDLRIRTMFIPGTYGVDLAPVRAADGSAVPNTFYNFCPNGHSLHKECKDWILEDRAFLDKSEDKGDLIAAIKSYPISVDEIFEMNDMGIIPPELLPRINRQKKEILGGTRRLKRYQLGDMGDRVVATPNNTANTFILELPVEGEEYIVGIDPIPTVDTKVKESKTGKTAGRSDYVAVVKRRSTQEYVAFYKQRSSDINVVKSNTVNLQKFYNQARAMVERNQGRELILQYRNDSESAMLAKYPMILGQAGFDKKEQTGFHKDRWNTERIYKFFFEYLKNHMERVWIIDIINELPQFVVSNTDLLDAMVACEVFDRDLQKKNEKFTSAQKFKTVPYMTIENGKSVRRWKKIPIFEDSESDPNKNYPTQWMTRMRKAS